MFSVANLFAQQQSPVRFWRIGAELPPATDTGKAPGLGGPLTGVPGKNYLLVAGGANFPDSMPWMGGKKKYYTAIYLFRKKGKGLIPVHLTDTLPEPLAYTAVCSTPMGIVFAGGENENGISAKAGILRISPVTQLLQQQALPPLPISLTNATATAHENIVYVAGGENTAGVSARCWSLDLNNPAAGWNELPPLPKPVSHAVFAAVSTPEGIKLVLAGGRRKTETGISELYNSVYTCQLESGGWKEIATLPYPLSAGTGYASGNHLFLFGGETGTTFSKVETLLAAINTASSATAKEYLVLQKNQLLSTHPGFSNEILHTDLLTGEIRNAGVLPYPVPVTTTACRMNNTLIIPSGEIKAGVRSPRILTATLKRRYR